MFLFRDRGCIVEVRGSPNGIIGSWAQWTGALARVQSWRDVADAAVDPLPAPPPPSRLRLHLPSHRKEFVQSIVDLELQ